MRILIWSDAGANTGYGTVTANLAARWARRGAELAALATNYFGDPWPGPIALYPATKVDRGDGFGIRRLPELLSKVKPDVLFILQDLYTVVDGLKVLQGRFPVPTVIYAPIDGTPLPREWVDAARAAHAVVAMSHHGARALKAEAGLDVPVLWHGVEHEVLYPASPDRPIYINHHGTKQALTSKAACKEVLGLSGRFVIVAVNRNTIRKNYPDTVRVFDRFRRRHPEAFLLMHAMPRGQGGDLRVLLQRYGLTEQQARIHNPGDPFLGSEKAYLTLMYNAADVKLSTAMAEGFGLTDAEALACGTPVVAQDYSATTEVVGPGGILVPAQRHFTTARMVDFALPDLDAMDAALETLYQDPDQRAMLQAQAIRHAQRFNWDQTAQGFWQLFEQIRAYSGVAMDE
ncbi:glycosyltransferase family 4 protein [Sulfobacillus thermosulfidooxidans]|uniref:glycosyltransferase family 4 protein n=1 Tax=Sulfobacillus thermosulfidooxidans TaxID=28034 RepID=UPI0006B582EA|nr:glycosyltransferase family 4 protein [Sulfobacillus thermosulfidooxidans]